jgi:hypothetical protein
VKSGVLSLPFPLHEDCWTKHSYQVRFPRHTARRSAVQSFRDWLLQEAAKTNAELRSFVSASRSTSRS